MLKEQTPRVENISNVQEWLRSNQQLLTDMKEFMEKNENAVGIAANQLGYLEASRYDRVTSRVCMTRPDGVLKVMINPEIVELIGTPSKEREGCLTWGRELWVEAMRYPKVAYTYYDEEGVYHGHDASGYEAQVIQHEVDHLDGKEEKLVERSSTFVKSKKIQRNDPCPCGSPKKYKNCCMKTM
jgi:peptide deformylase